jgi:hypothetical protein
MGEMKEMLTKFCLESLTGGQPLGKPVHKLKDGIKIGLRELGLKNAYWINLAQDRERWQYLVNMALNIRNVLLHSQEGFSPMEEIILFFHVGHLSAQQMGVLGFRTMKAASRKKVVHRAANVLNSRQGAVLQL